MPHFRVFLGAPTAADLRKNLSTTYRWQTVPTPPPVATSSPEGASDWIVPPATLAAASQRISLMYQNVIFGAEEEEEDHADDTGEGQSEEWDESRADGDLSKEDSLISWPPTNPKPIAETTRQSQSFALSRTHTELDAETQDISASVSYAHTSDASIAAFPTFVLNLHALTPLSVLLAPTVSVSAKWSRKVHVLAAVLEADGPDAVTIKKGADAGREVGVLRLVLGDERGGVCRLTAWREVADRWGGNAGAEGEAEAVRRGDIVYIENILASPAPPPAAATMTTAGEAQVAPIALTASPHLSSRLHICYRTLPTIPADRWLRPDLRLAASDPGLRRVAGIVRWFQEVVGLG